MMKNKFYLVNIEKCEGLDPCFDGVKEFMVMDGQYGCDFDVVEDSLAPDFCNAIRYETKCAKEFQEAILGFYSDAVTDMIFEENDYMPIGFNKETIPGGATITELER